MRFERLDLNLLVALNALIELRSVTAAANKLCLSQSALSGSLGRLREYFDDEILVQVGREMVLTPRAEDLAEPVRSALGIIRSTITTPASFDPATATRNFSVIASDYVSVVLLNPLLRDLAHEAPNVTFNILQPSLRAAEQFEAGEVDLLIGLQFNMRRDFPSMPLFRDESVAIVWTGSDLYDGPLTLEKFQSVGHVYTYLGEDRPESFYERELIKLGIERRNQVRVGAFSLMPAALIGTDRLAVMHRRYAEHFAQMMPLRIMPLPFGLPGLEILCQWHTFRNKDRGLIWLRQHIMRVAEQVPPFDAATP